MTGRFAITFLFGALPTLVAGCGSGLDLPDDRAAPASDDAGGIGGDAPAKSTTCAAKLAVRPLSPVAELRANVAFPVELDMSDPGGVDGAHPVEVVLARDGEKVKTLVSAKNGEDLVAGTTASLGKAIVSFVPRDVPELAPGAYTIEATLGCPSAATSKTTARAKADLHVARLGAIRIDVAEGDGARVPLMYHAVDGVAGNAFPIGPDLAASSIAIEDGEAELDDPTGAPRTFPEPWDDLSTPKTDASGAVIEEGVSYPVSLKVGTRPDLLFTAGETTLGAKGPIPAIAPGAPKLRLVLDGGGKGAAPYVDGRATVRLEASPVPAVDRYPLDLAWHYEAEDHDGKWVAVPGATQSAKLRVYGVLGNEIGTSAPNLPWVAVVDAATARVAGKSVDPAAIRAALVQLVYEEMGLRYDRKAGASAYTSYTGGYASARFELASFLKRSRGDVVNCTDCASILSTYTNMIGVKLHYAIIGWSFSLNPILGIGGTTPGSPFDSGRYAFNYHAVTTHDATKTINDATLALDGDVDPKSAPFSKKLVQNVPGSEYLTRLSPGAPEYKYVDQVTTVR